MDRPQEADVSKRNKTAQVTTKSGKSVRAKVAKAERRERVTAATNRVKTKKAVDVHKVLRD